jgi:hypothetical protein
MSLVTVHAVQERETTQFTATLKDETDAALPDTSLLTLTLTLRDCDTDTILNSRDGQNVLNANDVTVSTAGLLTWEMQPADSPIVTTTKDQELHEALFIWTWSGGSKTGRHVVRFLVENMARVP